MTATFIDSSDPSSRRQPGAVLLRNISWRTYQALLEEVGDDPLHLTYDNGLLEIEVPSDLHERLTELVGALAETVLVATDVEFQPLGSKTWNKGRLRGIEADKCYYITNVDAIAEREVIDLRVDPPPDLAIETEVSEPLVDKVKIYGALGVPELWRVSVSGQVRLFQLDRKRRYQPITRSLAIPQLDDETLTSHTRLLRPLGLFLHSRVLRVFRKWLASQDIS
jgi:Uma2 family endonuclease